LLSRIREEESLQELYDWILRVMQSNNYTFEMIFVDDGSRDNSWSKISSFVSSDLRIKGIRFKTKLREIPQHCITAFQSAQGDVVITLDSDLQDSPEEIPSLYGMIKNEGYDLVSGWKKKRYTPPGKPFLQNFSTL